MFRNPRLLLLAFALVAVVVLLTLLAFTVARPPARPPPLPNPNGYDDFIKAGEAVLGDISDWPVLDHESLVALVCTNAEPLCLLRLGLTRQSVMPMDFSLTNNARFLPRGRINLALLLAAEGRLREM